MSDIKIFKIDDDEYVAGRYTWYGLRTPIYIHRLHRIFKSKYITKYKFTKIICCAETRQECIDLGDEWGCRSMYYRGYKLTNKCLDMYYNTICYKCKELGYDDYHSLDTLKHIIDEKGNESEREREITTAIQKRINNIKTNK